VTDEDCWVDEDCCDCSAVGPSGRSRPHGARLKFDIGDPCDTCDFTVCDEYGTDTAECRFGTCQLQRVGCDFTTVVCDTPEPECNPPYSVAAVQDGCWTGYCVPPIVCDVVPDCSFCTGWVCTNLAGADKLPTCEPIPYDCGDDTTCACAGAQICGDDDCTDVDGGVECG
jgi:hypothetical protein